ncbi:MAG: hypothetical protein H6Q09_428 [Acidobacteria bacterium]|nr:hypothetical protein [Acidobacteriota bacterium]
MRLRRGGRNKETTVDSSPATPPASAGQPDEPRPIQPPPSGSVLGLSSAVGGAPEGPTDEWGFYDPDLAGVGALLSTLDTSAISFPSQVDEDPGDLLLRQEVRAATEPIEAFPSAFQGEASEIPRVSPAITAVASCRVPHLSPLSLWARVSDVDPCEELPRGPDRISGLLAQRTPASAFRHGTRLASSDLAAEVGRLLHPALVAMTGLSPACRIRGIRTEPVVAEAEPDGDPAGWPVAEVVAAPAAAVTKTCEEPAGEVAVVPEPVLTQGLEDLVAGSEMGEPPVQESASDETVAEAQAPEEGLATDPAMVPEAAPDQPPAVEPLPEVETAEELGIIVEAPALEALPSEFMPDALPGEAVPPEPDVEAIGETMSAADPAPLEAACEPAQVLQAVNDVWSVLAPAVEETPCSIPVVPQVPAPARRRRRTALALG